MSKNHIIISCIYLAVLLMFFLRSTLEKAVPVSIIFLIFSLVLILKKRFPYTAFSLIVFIISVLHVILFPLLAVLIIFSGGPAL